MYVDLSTTCAVMTEDDYIGESGQPYQVRQADHHKNINSTVFQHLRATGHKLSDGKILDKDSRGLQRGVHEPLCIRSLHPSLNQDQGRHHPMWTYDSLLLPAVSSRSLPSGTDTSATTTNKISSHVHNSSEQACMIAGDSSAF